MSRATFQTHFVTCWCTQKNLRIVWSRLRLPFWIRPKHCAHVPYGGWFERCTTHMVPDRGCSWKGCASNADGRRLVRPCSGPNQHIHRRPTPQLAWHAKAARQAASSRVTLLDRSRVQSRLGQRDDAQSGQVDRFRVRTRFTKPYSHCPNPSQNCRCVQAGCTRTVKRTDVAFEEAPPASRKRRLDHESLSQSKVDCPEDLGAIAEEEGKARKQARGGVRNFLTARRQVERATSGVGRKTDEKMELVVAGACDSGLSLWRRI